MDIIKSPMVYFGGKSRIAPEIWKYLGKTDRYIEPFFGSGAMLLANPHPDGTFEVVNDIDHFLANVWRSLKYSPDETARHADFPVNEIELHLNHLWLVNEGREILRQCASDEYFHSPEAAGRWLAGNASWIGGEFCSGLGPWTKPLLAAAEEHKCYDVRQLPHLGNGQGVSRRLPYLRSDGQGVSRRLPHLRDDGRGINRQLPDEEQEFDGLIPVNTALRSYLRQISRRLKNVRVCCGDWSRITGPSVTNVIPTQKNTTCAVFLDPPYTDAKRASVYKDESFTIGHDVREWCIAHGNNPQYRIALCGYDGEHNELETSYGWTTLEWKAAGGYSSQARNDSNGKANKHRERVWLSPHCLKQTPPEDDSPQITLF